MKTKQLKFLGLLFLFISAVSCSNDDDMNHEDQENHNPEDHGNVSLLVSDANSTALNLINPFTSEIQTFQASFPKGVVYVTQSGLYGIITHREHDFTETFNLGGEIDHGDHNHSLGETGLTNTNFESMKPTHFKSEQGYVAVYNDGDATLSLFKENDINGGASVSKIATGTTAHHGAMVIFDNGNIAVTNLGSGIGLPEKVHIINHQGEVISQEEQSLSTSGIHGSAGNDDTAIFGAASGILVVQDNGDQRIIDYPESFEEGVWFGSILATNEPDIFIGYTAAKGVYFIDIATEKITPLLETSDLFKCMVSLDGNEVVSLTKTGSFTITDVSTKEHVYNGTMGITLDTESSDHSSITSNVDYFEDYLFVSIPTSNKIIQYNLSEMNIEKEYDLDITPYQFKVLSYDIAH